MGTAGRDRSYLLTGSRLAQFQGWSEQTGVALTPDERAYLDASCSEDRRKKTQRETGDQREFWRQHSW